MADIAPLWPLRYDAGLLEWVVAPPHEALDEDTRKQFGEQHPHNVVHIELPEGDRANKYERALGLFAEWQEMGVVVRDEAPAYWRYAQTFDTPGGGPTVTRHGLLALVRAVPFSERVVLPHEAGHGGPSMDRIRLARALRAVTSPQLMLYSDPERRLGPWLELGESTAEFSTPDRIRHQIWRITAPDAIRAITDAMSGRTLVLADGHHHYQASLALSEEFEAEAAERGITTTDRSEHRFTLAMLVDVEDKGLIVRPIHRLVHSLPKCDWNDLLTQARVLFDVFPVAGSVDDLLLALSVEQSPSLGALNQDGKAVKLVLRRDADLAGHPALGKRPRVLRDNAVTLLHDGLLEYVLGITPAAQAERTNLKYLHRPSDGVAELERGTGQVLFLLNAMSVSTVTNVVETGELVPEQSIDLYPKVPAGLCFHTLYPDRLIP